MAAPVEHSTRGATFVLVDTSAAGAAHQAHIIAAMNQFFEHVDASEAVCLVTTGAPARVAAPLANSTLLRAAVQALTFQGIDDLAAALTLVREEMISSETLPCLASRSPRVILISSAREASQRDAILAATYLLGPRYVSAGLRHPCVLACAHVGLAATDAALVTTPFSDAMRLLAFMARITRGMTVHVSAPEQVGDFMMKQALLTSAMDDDALRSAPQHAPQMLTTFMASQCVHATLCEPLHPPTSHTCDSSCVCSGVDLAAAEAEAWADFACTLLRVSRDDDGEDDAAAEASQAPRMPPPLASLMEDDDDPVEFNPRAGPDRGTSFAAPVAMHAVVTVAAANGALGNPPVVVNVLATTAENEQHAGDGDAYEEGDAEDEATHRAATRPVGADLDGGYTSSAAFRSASGCADEERDLEDGSVHMASTDAGSVSASDVDPSAALRTPLLSPSDAPVLGGGRRLHGPKPHTDEHEQLLSNIPPPQAYTMQRSPMPREMMCIAAAWIGSMILGVSVLCVGFICLVQDEVNEDAYSYCRELSLPTEAAISLSGVILLFISCCAACIWHTCIRNIGDVPVPVAPAPVPPRTATRRGRGGPRRATRQTGSSHVANVPPS